MKNVILGLTMIASIVFSAGASAEDRFVGFRSANGSWVVAEGGGGRELFANRPAQGPWERFLIQDGGPLLSGDRICIRTDNGHFVVAESGGGREMNANRSSCNEWERFTIVLFADIPPFGPIPVPGEIPLHLREVVVGLRASNGDWVAAEGGGGGAMNANRPAPGPWERFRMVQNID